MIRNFHAFIACPAVEPTWRSNDKSFSVDNADRLPFLGLAIEPLQRIASHSIQFLSLKSSPQRIADSRSAFSMGRLLRALFTRHGSLRTKLLMISLEIDTLTRLGQFLFSFLCSRVLALAYASSDRIILASYQPCFLRCIISNVIDLSTTNCFPANFIYLFLIHFLVSSASTDIEHLEATEVKLPISIHKSVALLTIQRSAPQRDIFLLLARDISISEKEPFQM